MRYWWVNQNQTHRQEVAGGYLWSPKRNADGGRNPFYEAMREVSPGDIVFSFVDTRIMAIGVADSYYWESPKPAEFGSAGQYWEEIGWKVRVRFTPLLNRVRGEFINHACCWRIGECVDHAAPSPKASAEQEEKSAIGDLAIAGPRSIRCVLMTTPLLNECRAESCTGRCRQLRGNVLYTACTQSTGIRNKLLEIKAGSPAWVRTTKKRGVLEPATC
jgi:hypothetical protein